ncbi:glycosyltransferase family 4 protein [Blastopirellula sp. JC732]|uniref:Glycosyltransferase family 4 protein n=1 Tax=Blastopirellula sediminis TaxID=2894196 RepID=A0A9X1MJV8_9BACT|nr:glycosyltransferase family 1 protein [Blastopirellula sediminis]MCC9609589.1 glycosyltransferase family 4 protein [Blastopirellula sediminis]MCC9627635.1 glycosyltransferase family 4 protein [Blastopirellula sediminis]
MLQVVLDLEKLRQPYCGLGQFAQYLGDALIAELKLRGIEPIILARKAQLDSFPGERTLEANLWRKEFLQRPSRFFYAGTFEENLIWHATHQQTRFLPRHPRTPVLLTVHDLNFLREKASSKIARERRRHQLIVDRATEIVAISKFVAQEVREELNVGDKPVHVIYNGVARKVTEPVRPAFIQDDRPFLFSIGLVQRKKNFHVLVDLIERASEYRMILAGIKTDAYAGEIEAQVRAKGLSDRFLLPGPVSDGEREWLYQNCSAFLFPSITEGFGLPPIEAMLGGKPTFLSRRTSLPEIGGQLAFYWDAFDGDHLYQRFADGMRRFSQDPLYGERLKAHAGQFCWRTAARQYVDLYEAIGGVERPRVSSAA